MSTLGCLLLHRLLADDATIKTAHIRLSGQLTFNLCALLRRFANGKGVQSLMNVLKAYAALDPEVGYCQVKFIVCLCVVRSMLRSLACTIYLEALDYSRVENQWNLQVNL